MTSGCATPHATLDFIAPSNATAGTPFTVTVNVVYQGKPDTVINSHIHFTSSDPAAVLPGDYYFTPADAGSHTWTNGFALSTPGNQTISGAIFDATGINGTAIIGVVPSGHMLRHPARTSLQLGLDGVVPFGQSFMALQSK